MKNDEFGDRMKLYESQTDTRLDVGLPIIARLDGRTFSKFTKHCKKPFDINIQKTMAKVTAALVEETHAAIGYTQSDEITLIWRPVEEGKSLIFDGRVLKMSSIFSSLASVVFNREYSHPDNRIAMFDCRVWNVPSKIEAANALLWRVKDCRRNAISAVAQSQFSHKQLQYKSQTDMLRMLAQQKNIDFEKDFCAMSRTGVFASRFVKQMPLPDDVYDAIPDHKKPDSRYVYRSQVKLYTKDDFATIPNKVEFIFGKESTDDNIDR